MLWLIPIYLSVGAAGGAACSIICEGKCPTWGDLITSIGIGALFWLPMLGLMALVAPFIVVGATAEVIAKTATWARVKKWWKRPICQKKPI